MKYSETVKQFADKISYTIPEGVRFHDTGLDLPAGLSREDWERVGKFMHIMELAQRPNLNVAELNRLRSELIS